MFFQTFLHCSVRTKKLHNISFTNFIFSICFQFALPLNRLGLKFSSLSVLLHKGLLMQDWVFRLGLYPINRKIYISQVIEQKSVNL